MIKGPLKVVIIGPPGSGKTQLAEMIMAQLAEKSDAETALYDGDNIILPTRGNADVAVMTVQCTPQQFDDPAELLRGYQARAGKL